MTSVPLGLGQTDEYLLAQKLFFVERDSLWNGFRKEEFDISDSLRSISFSVSHDLYVANFAHVTLITQPLWESPTNRSRPPWVESKLWTLCYPLSWLRLHSCLFILRVSSICFFNMSASFSFWFCLAESRLILRGSNTVIKWIGIFWSFSSYLAGADSERLCSKLLNILDSILWKSLTLIRICFFSFAWQSSSFGPVPC